MATSLGTRQQDPRVTSVVDALVAKGLLSAENATTAGVVVRGVLAGESQADDRRLRGVLAEVAGYLGGVLVVAAVAIALATQWGDLSLTTRYWALGACFAVLAIAGFAVIAVSGGRGATAASDTRRRLASLLLTGAAIVAGASTTYWTVNETSLRDQWPSTVGAGVVAVLALATYVLLANGFAHIVLAGSLMMLIQSVAIGTFESEIQDVYIMASMMLLLAVVWGVATEYGLLREGLLGRLVTAVIAFTGAQVLATVPEWADGTNARWIGYLALAVVGAMGFVLYVRTQAWPYLVVGVAGLTAAATEAAVDWSDGALGAAGALLVAGVVLLAASALGLRLRQHDGDGDVSEHGRHHWTWHHRGHGHGAAPAA